MKKIIALLVIVLGVLALSSLVMAGSNPGTGIVGTSHDLTSATGRGALYNAGTAADPTLDRLCIYCHTPHHSATATDATNNKLDYYPLWNHDVTQQAAYTLYTNTNDGTIPNNIQHQLNAVLVQPGSVSRLCLSCHDGSVAVSSYGNFDSGANPTKHTGNVMITATAGGAFGIGVNGNLSNHHPIGFDYTAVSLADDEIRDPSSTLLGNNPYNMSISDLLWGGKMECSSCHDVHNTKNTGDKFTWVQDTNSSLCFSCHKK